ncbi:thioesterase family protein [Gammaproteobacteria bacterium]|nr:thioesterase family protein [Gammaproteobacteria bacterium]MDA7734907.1 thioesterase family protein [Gammaproteobacteria bacterium]MDA8674961.1 thioesterase family protein [Gammaproteobacteria bacterium]MDA8683373.1 thioesterase family protein [Gammaproteobacteria bacterium]MDA8861404.1 thioesterase family protein [Gammaproteobacteria bacterium]
MFKLPYLANQITVTSDMCDHNDHMNVNFYYKMFDEVYSKLYFEELDFSPEYVASGFSTFTLEDNIRYLKEFRLGDKIYPSFLLNNANEKMLHFVGILLNENNELAAIFETVLGHINLNERKMVAFSDDRLKNILEYKERTKLDQDLPFELKLKIRDL